MSNSLWPHEPQHARPPCPLPTPGVHPNPRPLSRWCHPTVLSSVIHPTILSSVVHPTILSSVVPSPPALNLSQHQGLFKWVSSSHQVAKVLKFQLQHQSFQWTSWIKKKGRGTRNQIANIHWTIEKGIPEKHLLLLQWLCKSLCIVCADHTKLWKILRELGIPGHLMCLLRNLYAGQEATVRALYETTDWFSTGKGVRQAVYCHPAYLTLCTYIEYIMWNARLNESQAESRLLGEISTTSEMQMIPL